MTPDVPADDDDRSLATAHGATSLSLADVLSQDVRFGSVSPSELFDALVEGEIVAFVRLPASFDCTLSIANQIWRGVDQADFAASFLPAPYSPAITYRLRSAVVLASVTSAIASSAILPFASLNMATGSTLLHFLGSPHPFGNLPEEEEPPVDIMLSQLRSDIALSPEAFVRTGGYVPFVLAEDASSVFKPAQQETSLPTKRRGAPMKDAWVEVWREATQWLLERYPEVSNKQLAGEILDRVQRRGVRNPPKDTTVIKELSTPSRNYRDLQ